MPSLLMLESYQKKSLLPERPRPIIILFYYYLVIHNTRYISPTNSQTSASLNWAYRYVFSIQPLNTTKKEILVCVGEEVMRERTCQSDHDQYVEMCVWHPFLPSCHYYVFAVAHCFIFKLKVRANKKVILSVQILLVPGKRYKIWKEIWMEVQN